MKKRILVITGSPRAGGNSDQMADAFIRGAESAGHAVTKVSAASLNIRGCIACNACYSTGSACAHPDDFNQIAALMEQSDALVLATPIYWFTFPAHLKAVIDKFYAFAVEEKKLPVKEAMLLVCGEMDDSSIFDGIINSYAQSCAYMNWQDRGCYYVTGVCEKGDIFKTSALAELEDVGKKF